jgi:hypothetical protein
VGAVKAVAEAAVRSRVVKVESFVMVVSRRSGGRERREMGSVHVEPKLQAQLDLS